MDCMILCDTNREVNNVAVTYWVYIASFNLTLKELLMCEKNLT